MVSFASICFNALQSCKQTNFSHKEQFHGAIFCIFCTALLNPVPYHYFLYPIPNVKSSLVHSITSKIKKI